MARCEVILEMTRGEKKSPEWTGDELHTWATFLRTSPSSFIGGRVPDEDPSMASATGSNVVSLLKLPSSV